MALLATPVRMLGVPELEFTNPASPLYQHPLLKEARRGFAAFYDIATGEDQTWMDNLVLAHVTLTEGTKIPRKLVPAVDRDSLERACDAVERKFMGARDRVRECATFKRLVPGHQKRIAAILFELFPPTE